jgi:hypothetical protein
MLEFSGLPWTKKPSNVGYIGRDGGHMAYIFSSKFSPYYVYLFSAVEVHLGG